MALVKLSIGVSLKKPSLELPPIRVAMVGSIFFLVYVESLTYKYTRVAMTFKWSNKYQSFLSVL